MTKKEQIYSLAHSHVRDPINRASERSASSGVQRGAVPLDDNAAPPPLSAWRIAHDEAQWWAKFTRSRTSKALEQAKKALRNGGFLLHIDSATGVERRISLKEAGRGVPFLCVWVRGGRELTLTRSQGAYGIFWPVRPPGQGWQPNHHHPVEEGSTAWHRPHVRPGPPQRYSVGC